MTPEQMSIGAIQVNRIRRIRQVLEAFEAGDMSASVALSQIEDIAAGEADRIIRVGTQHTPEVQS